MTSPPRTSLHLLVSGATGFLGSRLVKHLLAQGHRVSILKRSRSDTRQIDNELSRVTVWETDSKPMEKLFETADSLDGVIHAATCYGRRNETETEIADTNIVFALKLLECAACNGAGFFINISTVLPRMLNAYSLSKKQFEEWGRRFGHKGTIRFVNVRLDHIYGPGDDSSKFPTFIIRSCLEQVPELHLTAGEQTRDFVYVTDVLSAIESLLRSEIGKKSGVVSYDVDSGEPICVRHFAETVKRLTKSNTRLVFGAIPYRPRELMRSSIGIKSIRRLGWNPRFKLEEGLKLTIEKEKRLFV